VTDRSDVAALVRARLTSSHWGVYEVGEGPAGSPALQPFRDDPAPSPIGLSMLEAYRSPLRVGRPAVRRGWLERGPADTTRARGDDPFVEVDWEHALELVAGELRRVIDGHGPTAIYGGSYGWASAGRFHHALSQIHRFLNCIGGCTRSIGSYSLGAAEIVLPHVVASMDQLYPIHHDWGVLAQHTRLFVSFGGVPVKNAQIGLGGVSEHRIPGGLAALAAAGCRFVNLSPVRGDLDVPGCEWIPIRPNTDTAVMLAMATELIRAGRHDQAFLSRCCVGFERWAEYLLGGSDGTVRDAQWASGVSGVPAERIRRLAMELTGSRSLLNAAWSLQRAEHGEQPYWAVVALASVIGQIGLPGGGFAVAYGPTNTQGGRTPSWARPTLPQGLNPTGSAIPVARVADMLLHPGSEYRHDGRRATYPDIRLVYWAGGNPFHHHQDLNRLARAWRRPETIVVHEQFWNANARMADIVLPATTTLERDDIGCALLDPLLVAMKRIQDPWREARDDHAIFAALAARLGVADAFTEGRDVDGWLRMLYERSAAQSGSAGFMLPPFDAFWEAGAARVPDLPEPVVMFEAFRRDPDTHRLGTPSGRIELFSERIASFGLDDCPGHPSWLAPVEWLGGEAAVRHPLHLISDQPRGKLHSQLDHGEASLATKVDGREPIDLHPDDAARRGIGDREPVRVFNDRGACVAIARVTPDIRRGVVRMATGAWWDPDRIGEQGSLCRHGNPNVLTRDVGTSRLAQGCAAQSCLVDVERWRGPLPPVCAFEGPRFAD
jgi:biotin/methionine sulfoxide reductase